MLAGDYRTPECQQRLNRTCADLPLHSLNVTAWDPVNVQLGQQP